MAYPSFTEYLRHRPDLSLDEFMNTARDVNNNTKILERVPGANMESLDPRFRILIAQRESHRKGKLVLRDITRHYLRNHLWQRH